MAGHLQTNHGVVTLVLMSRESLHQEQEDGCTEPRASRVDRFLVDAMQRLRRPAPGRSPARFGVDLGSASIVLCATSDIGDPVYWDSIEAEAVRDGVVVDFQGAADAVRALKDRAEAALGMAVESAAVAHPPEVPVNDGRAFHFVLEQGEIECRVLTDEIQAANALLQLQDGAIVDVGGGSTGVGVFANGQLISVSDQPGGGHQLDLILAGALGLSIEKAEQHKRKNGGEAAPLLRPGIERIAESIRRQCAGRSPGVVHLAGGALSLPGSDDVIASYLGWPVCAYPHAELITPFGIALS